MTGYQDIAGIYQGENITLTFDLLDGGAPLDVTGWTIIFRVGVRGNENVLALSCTLVDAAAGQISVTLTPTDLAQVGVGYTYEIRRTNSGSVRTLVVGAFRLADSLFVVG